MRFELTNNHYETVKECFADDEELLNKHHIKAGKGLDICVKDTVEVLSNNTHHLKFYSIFLKNTRIGFFGTEEDYGDFRFLTTFCIKPEYRNKENINEFWENIKKYFYLYNFYTSLYAKNKRAVNFCLKKGEIIKTFSHNNSVAFLFKFNNLK